MPSAFLAVLMAPLQASASPTPCASLEIDAHRGYHYPTFDENSLKGMAEAAARGYEIETDVWSDAEGQLWIFHDRNPLRTTGVNGYIDKMTTAQVAALRYKKAKSPLPRFEEALAAWKSYPTAPRIYLEVKQKEQILRIAQLVREAGLSSRLLFTSYTSYLHHHDPAALLQVKSFSSKPDPVTLARNGVTSLQVGVEQLTSADVDAYQAQGVEVQVKTTNTTAQWREAIQKGFDGVLTDFPNELRDFCPAAPPVITSFSPTSGPAGTAVTIEGTDLAAATSVKFGTTEVSSFTVVSDSQITTTAPAGLPAESLVSVTTPGGTVTSTQKYVSSSPGPAAPTISSFSPTSGAAGTAVTIAGSNLAGATSVKFGSTEVSSFTAVSESEITTTAPAGLPTEVTISVTTPGGTVTSVEKFTSAAAAPAAPVIASFTPGSGPIGTVVTITGSYFTGARAVKFGSVPAASFTVDSDTQITAVVPADAPPKAKVLVATAAGPVQSADFFSVPPVITSFTPTKGPVGTLVTLSGTTFTRAVAVRFGAYAATFNVESSTKITVTVPAGVPAFTTIAVKTPGGWGYSPGRFARS